MLINYSLTKSNASSFNTTLMRAPFSIFFPSRASRKRRADLFVDHAPERAGAERGIIAQAWRSPLIAAGLKERKCPAPLPCPKARSRLIVTICGKWSGSRFLEDDYL
jgi:hypothetical protein